MKIKLLCLSLLVLSLTGCSVFRQATPQPLPTIVLDQGSPVSPVSARTGSGGAIASGVAAPAREAELAFGLAGKIEALNVSVGDEVDAGQELARLQGQESLEAKVSTARFELEQAKQALNDLVTQSEDARVLAMQEIVTYERAVRDAQYTLDNFTVPSNQAGFDAVEALNQMKQRLDNARQEFEPYRNKASGDPVRQDRKDDLDAAQSDYNAAVRRLQLEYNLQVAQAQLDRALGDYETLKAGPDPDELLLAEARQEDAQNQLSAAQAALQHLTLTAPFAGTVSKINFTNGEWVAAGQPVLVLADLGELQVETTDLSERDIPRVEVGQEVTVYIGALNQTVPGRVLQIAPLADTLGGDVVYKVTIELDEPPPGLRAGMSVEVQFGANP